jgi:hypothetical protein
VVGRDRRRHVQEGAARLLSAEAAADPLRLDDDLAQRQAERVRDKPLVLLRALAAGKLLAWPKMYKLGPCIRVGTQL